jgi:hypothetical protein
LTILAGNGREYSVDTLGHVDQKQFLTGIIAPIVPAFVAVPDV